MKTNISLLVALSIILSGCATTGGGDKIVTPTPSPMSPVEVIPLGNPPISPLILIP